MVSGIIYGMFALFLVLGILFGLKRGLTKSIIRFVAVLISCVAVIFIAQPITNAVLTADISSSGLEIGGVPVTTIEATIVNYISQISVVAQLMQASPTLKALVTALPTIILNLVLFVLLFFITKGILYFVGLLINKFAVKKDAPKRRLWGALVGAVQGIVVFLFVLMPIAGTMNLITDTTKVLNNSSTTATASAATVDSGNQTGVDLGNVNISNVVDEYNDIFIIKMFNAIGYKSLTNSVFDKLTTMELSDTQSTTLRTEATVLAKVVTGYDKLKNVDVSKFSAENETDAKNLIDAAFESPIIGGVATELVTGLSNAWVGANPSDFAGVEKPVLDSKLLEGLDAILINLRTSTTEDLKSDLKVIVGVLKISADYNLTENINGENNTDNLVQAIGQEGCVENIVGTLASGKTTKAAISAFIEYGLSYGYDAVGLENVSTNITKTADEINWETEKVILGDMFEGVSATYLSSKKQGSVLKKLDFMALAKTMNAIRSSELLQGAGQQVTLSFLNSNILVGVDTSTLRAYVENSTQYSQMDFAVMFTTLKSSAEIASNIQDKIQNPTADSKINDQDVQNLITSLTTPGATKEVLVDLASKDNLTQAGVDSQTATAVGEIVNAIAGYDTTAPGAVPAPSAEQIPAASDAVETILLASKTAQSKSYVFSDDEMQAKAKMTEFVQSMLASDFVYAATISRGEELGFTTDGVTNLSVEEKGWLNSVLNDELDTNPKATESKCEEIAEMFGIDFVLE